MKVSLSQLLFSILIIALGNSCNKAEIEDTNDIENKLNKIYYIDDQSDFDGYNGFYFPPGSTIAFATGKTFIGQFLVRGIGSYENPNIVTAYDPESGELLIEWTDNKPIINGEGKHKAALYVYNI